eukprot:1157850-Pelagomonas_calceolata.AAC.12
MTSLKHPQLCECTQFTRASNYTLIGGLSRLMSVKPSSCPHLCTPHLTCILEKIGVLTRKQHLLHKTWSRIHHHLFPAMLHRASPSVHVPPVRRSSPPVSAAPPVRRSTPPVQGLAAAKSPVPSAYSPKPGGVRAPSPSASPSAAKPSSRCAGAGTVLHMLEVTQLCTFIMCRNVRNVGNKSMVRGPFE